MKCNKYFSVPLALVLGLSLTTYNVHAEKDNMKENNSQVLGFQEFRFIEVQNINNRTIS